MQARNRKLKIVKHEFYSRQTNRTLLFLCLLFGMHHSGIDVNVSYHIWFAHNSCFTDVFRPRKTTESRPTVYFVPTLQRIQNTANRKISLFGEGLARTNPNITWKRNYITCSMTVHGYKLLSPTSFANCPCGILWRVHLRSRCEHFTIGIWRVFT